MLYSNQHQIRQDQGRLVSQAAWQQEKSRRGQELNPRIGTAMQRGTQGSGTATKVAPAADRPLHQPPGRPTPSGVNEASVLAEGHAAVMDGRTAGTGSYVNAADMANTLSERDQPQSQSIDEFMQPT